MKYDIKQKIKKDIDEDIDEREAKTKIYYLDRMVEELQKGYLCVFAGAGLSAASGYVDWKTLLKPMGEQLGLNLNMDLTLLAQYYENEFTRDELNRRIMQEFAKIPQKNDNMELLATMPISRYWTTNYDSIIEDTLVKEGKIVDVIKDQLQFKYHSPERDAIVFKMHGNRELPDRAVLCKDDYEKYDETRVIFTQGLMMDLISNTFLFIGFSFSDPNLDRIISILRRNFKGETLKKHYCFLRNVQLNDYINHIKEEDDESIYLKAKEQFLQDKNAQKYKISYMRKYGIETILVNEFEEIKLILRYMRDNLLLNTVFISGGLNPQTPNEYGAFQKKERDNLGLGKAELFIMDLSNELIYQGYKIITGFGVGVGNYVVTGAYKNRERKGRLKFEDKVYIQPIISVEEENPKIKNSIRKEMIDKCGINIVIFGKSNEDTSEDRVVKDGTYVEYDISEEMNKIIIPVGATGFTSRIIYDREKKKWMDNLALYERLGNRNSSNQELIEGIMSAIKYKKKKREEEMKDLLIKYIGKDIRGKKKVFVSFEYKSSIDYLCEINAVIKKTQNYYPIEETEKCDPSEIEQWINDKVHDADLIIVIFNNEFQKSKWTEYEVKMCSAKKIPFLFLINDKQNLTIEMLKDYIHKLSISKYDIFQWEKMEDFNKIPQKLDQLLENFP